MVSYIMEIEVKKLNALKKYTVNFQFEYLPENNLCLVPLSEISGAVKVSGEYEIYDDDCVGVRLTVSYRISGQCSYCLKAAQKLTEFTSDILFVPEHDGDNYFYDGIRINLKTAVDDAILISQPSVLLCKEDCTGIDVPK